MAIDSGQEEVKKAACTFCYANCGVLVHVKDGKVTRVEGNREHQLTHGHVCERVGYATSLGQIAHFYSDADYLYYCDPEMYEDYCEYTGSEQESMTPIIPIQFVSEEADVPWMMDIGDPWGMSLYPDSIYMRYERYLKYGEWAIQKGLKHECYHYFEQSEWGFWAFVWYAGYISEYGFEIVRYLDMDVAHDAVEAEKGAMGFAEQKPKTGTSPWWEIIPDWLRWLFR